MKILEKIVAILAVLFLLENADAADIYTISPYSGYNVIIIEGEITRGDYDQFITEVEATQGRTNIVFITSPGGTFLRRYVLGAQSEHWNFQRRSLALGEVVLLSVQHRLHRETRRTVRVIARAFSFMRLA